MNAYRVKGLLAVFVPTQIRRLPGVDTKVRRQARGNRKLLSAPWPTAPESIKRTQIKIENDGLKYTVHLERGRGEWRK